MMCYKIRVRDETYELQFIAANNAYVYTVGDNAWYLYRPGLNECLPWRQSGDYPLWIYFRSKIKCQITCVTPPPLEDRLARFASFLLLSL